MTDTPTQVVLTTSIPIPKRDQLRLIAERNDRSIAAEIRRAIDAHIERELELLDVAA